MAKETFKLTSNHIKLLQNMYWRMSDCEFGAPEVDGKRPYGNSYVEPDIAEIIGMKFDREEGLSSDQERECRELHNETVTAIEIILSTKSFKTGTYARSGQYGDYTWKLVK